MCFLAFTNFQREGAVANMMAGEVMAAQKGKNLHYMIVLVWEHKTVSTHGSAPNVMHTHVYQLLLRYSQSDIRI